MNTYYRVAIIGIMLVFCTAAVPAHAQNSFTDGLNDVKTLAGENKLAEASGAKDILQNIVKWLLTLVGTIATISLLYGGFLYITSQGEEDQASKAKHIILYSVIGIIIIGISAIVVNVVINVVTQ